MQYRQFRDVNLSEIGMGCYGLGGGFGKVDIDSYKATLRRAFELGINYFDTSDNYGDAEIILGEVIRSFREKVYIATKVGWRIGARPTLEPKYMRSACEKSLKRLGVETIDVYHLHHDVSRAIIEETIDTLEQLKSEGKIRYYGLGYTKEDRVLEYLNTGDIFSMMIELNPVARSARRSRQNNSSRY